MVRCRTTKGLILRTLCRLVGYQVRPCAAQTCRTNCLVCIHHNLVLSRLLNTILIVINHPLRIVMLANRQQIAHISRFHRWIFIFVHKLIRRIQPSLIVAYRTRRLVVHNHLHTLTLGILVNTLYIKVWIWCHKVIHKVLLVAEPVFPTDIPSFYQYATKAILSSKVNIAFHILRSSTVATMRFRLSIIRLANMDRREVPCIGPVAHTCNHLPPYAYILHRLDPRSIFYLTGLVQVQHNTRCQNIFRTLAYHHNTPWAHSISLDMTFRAINIRSQPRTEHHRAIIQIQVHTRIIHQCRLMDIHP